MPASRATNKHGSKSLVKLSPQRSGLRYYCGRVVWQRWNPLNMVSRYRIASSMTFIWSKIEQRFRLIQVHSPPQPRIIYFKLRLSTLKRLKCIHSSWQASRIDELLLLNQSKACRPCETWNQGTFDASTAYAEYARSMWFLGSILSQLHAETQYAISPPTMLTFELDPFRAYQAQVSYDWDAP